MIRNEVFSAGACVSAEIIDLNAGTIAFEESGVITSTRPLTVDEVAQYTPTAEVASAEERLVAAKAVLEQLDALPAPVLTADVVDLLDDLRGAL